MYGQNAAKTALSLRVEICQSMARAASLRPTGHQPGLTSFHSPFPPRTRRQLAGPIKTPGKPRENFDGSARGADYNKGIVFELTQLERTRGQRRTVNRFLDRLAITLVGKEVVFDRHMF